MDGPRDYHTKQSKPQKDKYHMIVTYMGNLKQHKATYLQNENRLTVAENRLVVAKEGGWEFGISRCNLLYIGWINSTVSLRSTDSHVPYPVIKHNRKEYEGESMCA